MSENMPAVSYLPFSQRNGFVDVPPQLKIGEVSQELRRLLHYAIDSEIKRECTSGYAGRYFKAAWEQVTKDVWVRFLKEPIDGWSSEVASWETAAKTTAFVFEMPKLFDFVEFLARHPQCSKTLKGDLAEAFVESRAAYRLFDNGQIGTIGTAEQASAFVRAVETAEANQAAGAKQHLLQAGVALRVGDWSGSVRESIHAVESVAVLIAPQEGTLGGALKALEKQGQIHGALKSAFSQLYGYSSDEEGVRHALVFGEKSKVDETDALFMLGACASFVSYLLTRMPDADSQQA